MHHYTISPIPAKFIFPIGASRLASHSHSPFTYTIALTFSSCRPIQGHLNLSAGVKGLSQLSLQAPKTSPEREELTPPTPCLGSPEEKTTQNFRMEILTSSAHSDHTHLACPTTQGARMKMATSLPRPCASSIGSLHIQDSRVKLLPHPLLRRITPNLWMSTMRSPWTETATDFSHSRPLRLKSPPVYYLRCLQTTTLTGASAGSAHLYLVYYIRASTILDVLS